MTPDPLDEILDHSAPRSRPASTVDLDAMVADARRAGPGPRRPRILIAAGLAAILASGGLGIAAATDVLSWAPWAQDPIGAVQFTLTNELRCELRFTEWTGGNDPAYVDEVNGILEEWYRSEDVLAAAQANLPASLERIGPIELQAGETLESLPPEEAQHREWTRQWRAWDLAIGDAEQQELTSHGIDSGDPRFNGSERRGQIACLDENNESYVPGAGS